MKNIMCEIKNTLNGINSIADTEEEKISELEKKAIECIQNKNKDRKTTKEKTTTRPVYQ